MATNYKVVAILPNGTVVDKGEIYINPRSKRWEWYKEGRGKEGFPHGATAHDVRARIAKLCLLDVTDIKLV